MKTGYSNPIPLTVSNLLTNSERFDLWVNTCAVTANVDAGIDQTTISADQLTDSSATVFQSSSKTVTVAANGSSYTAQVWFRKTTGQTNTSGYNLSFSGGTPVSATPRINTNSGTATSGGTVTDAGTYWILKVTLANNSTNTSLTLAIQPATGVNSGTTTGADAASTTGSCVVGAAQLELGTVATTYNSTTTTSGIHFDSIISFLQRNPVFYNPELFTITLASGLQITTTSHPVDLISGGVTYYASRFGLWSRGAYNSTNKATQVEDMPLTVACDQTVLFPGSNTPLLQTVASSIFDGARISMSTAYFLQGYNPNNLNPAPIDSRYTAVNFVGDIVTSADPLTTTNATFKVSALPYLLQEPWPQRVVQSGCTYALFDKNCALNKASFVQNKTIAAGSSALIVNLNTALPNAAPYYDAGFITFTSGQNIGLSYSIAHQLSTTQLQLNSPILLPISVGDAYGVYPGCDKTLGTCQTKFANQLRFSGAPNVPEPERTVAL